MTATPANDMPSEIYATLHNSWYTHEGEPGSIPYCRRDDVQALIATLEMITRMAPFPDHSKNTTTLVACRRLARAALSAFQPIGENNGR